MFQTKIHEFVSKYLIITFLASVVLTGCGGGTSVSPTGSAGIPSGSDPVSNPDPGNTPVPPPPPKVPVDIVVNGQPQLLYSDLVKAPPGAFVTVWGQNIPSTATFTCGNEPCELISFDYDLNHPAHGNQPSRQKIVVKFNSGSGITLDGYNTLPFTTNSGKIWELTPGPIGPTLDAMNPGDVLYLRGGTYNVEDPKSYGSIIWANKNRDGLAVIGYPGERVILDLRNGNLKGFDTIDDIHNWTVANMECLGAGNITTSSNNGKCISASRAGSRTNLRIVGMYNHGTGVNGTGAFGEFSHTVNLYVLGNFSENTGTSSGQTHSFYHGGRGINDNVNFEFNNIGRHVGRRGLQIYGHLSGESMSNLRIRYNYVHDQGSNGILVSHTDGQSGDPQTRCWISDALVEGNTVENTSSAAIRFLGCDANPSGPVDFIAKDNYVDGNIVADFPTGVSVKDNCALGYTGSYIDDGGNSSSYPTCSP
jgi:hypothetical protein